jgi:hypothetical protein
MKMIKEFIDYAFFRNVYLLIHFMGGFIYSMIHIPFCLNYYFDRKYMEMYLIILIVAVVWELIEFLYYGKERLEKIYGKFKYFIYDGIGDIIIALIGGFIVSLF